MFIFIKYLNNKLKFYLIFFFLCITFDFSNLLFNNYSKDNITLVTALFKIKSKFPFDKYLLWVENLFLFNSSIVFLLINKFLILLKTKGQNYMIIKLFG